MYEEILWFIYNPSFKTIEVRPVKDPYCSWKVRNKDVKDLEKAIGKKGLSRKVINKILLDYIKNNYVSSKEDIKEFGELEASILSKK